MDTERTQTTVNPEAWAAAQVEEVVKGLEEKTKRTKRTPPPKVRGVSFRLNPAGEVRDHLGRPGDWYIRWTDGTGQEHREKCGSRPAALDLYGKRRAEVRAGHQFPESMRRKQAVNLSAIFAAYVAALKVDGRDPNDEAKARLAEVLASLGDVAADTVRPADIEELKATLAATPATGRRNGDGTPRPRRPATVNRYLQALKAAFNVAKRAGVVDANPAAGVKLLRENNKRVREMSPEEEKAILAALEPSRRRFHTDLRPLVRFLTATGLRAGEACNLRWADIDWRAEVATLRQTKAGKVQHATLSAEAVAILQALGAQADGLARRNGKAERNPFVFCWPDGRPLTVDFLTRAFHVATVKAGVVDLHVHDCRHAFACRLLRAGVDIFTVSKLLRHASVTMSERYSHLSQADLKAAVERKSLLPSGTPGGTLKSESL